MCSTLVYRAGIAAWYYFNKSLTPNLKKTVNEHSIVLIRTHNCEIVK